MVNAPFNQGPAIAQVPRHVMMLGNVVPALRGVVHEINAKSGPLASHGGFNAEFVK